MILSLCKLKALVFRRRGSDVAFTFFRRYKRLIYLFEFYCTAFWEWAFGMEPQGVEPQGMESRDRIKIEVIKSLHKQNIS